MKTVLMSLCVKALSLGLLVALVACAETTESSDTNSTGTATPDGTVSNNGTGGAGGTGDTGVDGGPSIEGTPCNGSDLSSAGDDWECPGNVGCTELEVECGMCTCTLCWNETCLEYTCDDGGSEECPWYEPDMREWPDADADAGAGGPSIEGTLCEGSDLSFADEDFECPGNVGCTELDVECGMCTCTLCWNETCLVVTCDDGGSEECPWYEPDIQHWDVADGAQNIADPSPDSANVPDGEGGDAPTGEDGVTDSTADAGADAGADADQPDATSLADDQCTVEKPCTTFGMCWAPDDDFCGACFSPDPWSVCITDADCSMQPDSVCAAHPAPCSCSGELECIPKCTLDTDCNEGETCDAGGHCVPSPCANSTECPANFACTDGGCGIQSCGASSECDGYCVKGKCYADPGFCSPPPP